MAKKKTTGGTSAVFSLQSFDTAHTKRTEAYTAAIERLYAKATTEIANAVAQGTYDPEKPFSFSDYPRIESYVKQVISKLAADVQVVISNGSRQEWLFACRKNDEFINSILNTTKLTKERLEKMQDRNLDALKTFQGRKVQGLDLSQRVWKYTDQYKAQLELGLDAGLGEGRSAQQLARDVKQNLKDPNRLFRRVRDKRGNLQLSKAAKAFHPGQGVYRSSVKNAQRLTRSEINMAYRESDYLRWQQLDFVIGFEVQRSNHRPLCKCDLCESLVGRYPKTFKFVGWHPQCMCRAVPITEDYSSLESRQDRRNRIAAAIKGTEYRKYPSAKTVTDVPDNFKEWVERHKGQQEKWGSTPYFIRDNFKDGLLENGLKAKVLPPEDPFKPLLAAIMPQVEQARSICNEWGLTGAANNIESGILGKSIEQVKAGITQATQEAIALEKELDNWLADVKSLLSEAQAHKVAVDSIVSDVNETAVHSNWIRNKAKYQQDAKNLEDDIIEAKDNEHLSTLLDDVADAKAKFGSDAVHAVYDAVEKKLAQWNNEDKSLAYLKNKLEFEVEWVGKAKKYDTWEVAQKAYQKRLTDVQYQIGKQSVETSAGHSFEFAKTTKSVKVKSLADELKSLLDKNAPIAELESKVAALNGEVSKLEAARLARLMRKSDSDSRFSPENYTQERRDRAIWDKGDGKKADDALVDVAGKTWSSATSEEKDRVYEYTYHYCNVNEPLQGRKYDGRQSKLDFEQRVNSITSYIDKSPLPVDMWFTRGDDGIGVIASRIRFAGGTMPKNLQDLVGMTMQEGGFMSTGSRKGKGFGYKSVVMNIYAPKGTKAAYVEPISEFGKGAKRSWDGKQRFSTFSNEHETLFQRGTKMRITKVYQENGKIYIDCEVVGQEVRPLSYVKDSDIGY